MYKIEISENDEVVFIHNVPAEDDPFGTFEAFKVTLEPGETVSLFLVDEKTDEKKLQARQEYGS
jgi:hypothetical protein